MKEITMFDISNPLSEEQMMEIEGSGCWCACLGDDQVNYPGWSNTGNNDGANDAGGLISGGPDPACGNSRDAASQIANGLSGT
jgi:hypothetical protein